MIQGVLHLLVKRYLQLVIRHPLIIMIALNFGLVIGTLLKMIIPLLRGNSTWIGLRDFTEAVSCCKWQGPGCQTKPRPLQL